MLLLEYKLVIKVHCYLFYIYIWRPSAWNVSFKVWVYSILPIFSKLSTHYLHENSYKKKKCYCEKHYLCKKKMPLLHLEWSPAVASEFSSIKVKPSGLLRRGGGLLDWALIATGGWKAAMVFIEWLLGLRNSRPFSFKYLMFTTSETLFVLELISSSKTLHF